MKVNTRNYLNPFFKGARINIVANSDNHGNITSLAQFYNTIKENEEDIFKESNKESTLNLYINAGDFFINGAKGGFRTNPNLTNMDVQKDFFQLLIEKVRKVANKKQWLKECEDGNLKPSEHKTVDKPVNFHALYTPGNHCYDGGDTMLYDALKSVNGVSVVMSNIDEENSPAIEAYDFDKKGSNFVTSKEFEIADDTYKHKKHHLMVLGATIPAMDFYNPGLLKQTRFVDANSGKDSSMEKKHIAKTIEALKEKTLDFKKRYPDGIIILASHMGTRLSKIVRDEIPQINEILDGHKHDVATFQKGDSFVSSQGQDNKIIKSISLYIDDFGDIERESFVFTTDQHKLGETEYNAFKRMLTGNETGTISQKQRECYQAESQPIVQISDTDNIRNMNNVLYTPDIRYANSLLANFLTTALKESISKVPGCEDVDVVGVQSSIIRGGLQDGASNLDLMKVFDGVSEKLSNVKVGNVTGNELFFIVLENIKDNIADKTRNTIIQWSDIQVNRTEIEKELNRIKDEYYQEAKAEYTKKALYSKAAEAEIQKNAKKAFNRDFAIAISGNYQGLNPEKQQELKEMRDDFIQTFAPYIKIKDGDTFVELDLSGSTTYKMAIANKYLTKEDIVMPRLIRNKFQDKMVEQNTPVTYHRLFMEYLNDESRAIDPEVDEEDVEDKGIIMTYVNPNGKTNRFYIDEIAGKEKRII